MSNSTQTSNALGGEGKLGVLILVILLVGGVLWSARGPRTEKADFSLTYVGITILQRGQSAHLYDRDFQIQVRDSLFSDPNPLLFEHPPFEALMLAPLAKLTYRNAYLLWGLLNVALLLVLVVRLRPYCQWPNQDLGYICLWILFAPLGVALFQGQPSLIALAGFAIAYIELKNRSNFYAGLGFGLALFRFQLALPFVLILVIRKKWKFLGGFACSAAGFAVLSLVAVGVSGIAQYVRLLSAIGTNPQDQSYGSAVDMGSLYGLLYALFGEITSHKVLAITAAVLSVVLLSYIAKRWNTAETESSSDLVFAAALVASLVVGAHMFTHDFSPLMLAMLIAGEAFFGNVFVQRGFVRNTMRAILMLLWTFPLYFVLVAVHGLFLLCPILLSFAFCALFGAKYLTSDAPKVAALATSG